MDIILGISHNPEMLKCIRIHFKLKEDKIEEPSTYLGANMSKMINFEGTECWAISSNEYCASSVANVENLLADKGIQQLS